MDSTNNQQTIAAGVVFPTDPTNEWSYNATGCVVSSTVLGTYRVTLQQPRALNELDIQATPTYDDGSPEPGVQVTIVPDPANAFIEFRVTDETGVGNNLSGFNFRIKQRAVAVPVVSAF